MIKYYTKYKNLILFLLFLLVNTGFAQRDGKMQFKEEFEKIMKQKMMEGLNIDDATADKFMETYKQSKQNLRVLMKEKRELQKSIEMDPEAIDIGTKLDKWMKIDTKIIESRNQYYNDLKTFLTPAQIAKSINLRKKVEKELRNELKKHRKQDKLDKSDKPDNESLK